MTHTRQDTISLMADSNPDPFCIDEAVASIDMMIDRAARKQKTVVCVNLHACDKRGWDQLYDHYDSNGFTVSTTGGGYTMEISWKGAKS
jgi:hypothetical protein